MKFKKKTCIRFKSVFFDCSVKMEYFSGKMLFDDRYNLWNNGPHYIAAEYFLETREKQFFIIF